jgi:hypothetical protein
MIYVIYTITDPENAIGAIGKVQFRCLSEFHGPALVVFHFSAKSTFSVEFSLNFSLIYWRAMDITSWISAPNYRTAPAFNAYISIYFLDHIMIIGLSVRL